MKTAGCGGCRGTQTGPMVFVNALAQDRAPNMEQNHFASEVELVMI